MKAERVDLLDSFRFLAILSVMLVHLTIRWSPPFYPVDVYPYNHLFLAYYSHMAAGVPVEQVRQALSRHVPLHLYHFYPGLYARQQAFISFQLFVAESFAKPDLYKS